VIDLANGISHSFRVRAINAIGYGPYASATATPSAALTVPDAPLNFDAAPGDGQATLTWTVPANDGGSPITGFEVSMHIRVFIS